MDQHKMERQLPEASLSSPAHRSLSSSFKNLPQSETSPVDTSSSPQAENLDHFVAALQNLSTSQNPEDPSPNGSDPVTEEDLFDSDASNSKANNNCQNSSAPAIPFTPRQSFVNREVSGFGSVTSDPEDQFQSPSISSLTTGTTLRDSEMSDHTEVELEGFDSMYPVGEFASETHNRYLTIAPVPAALALSSITRLLQGDTYNMPEQIHDLEHLRRRGIVVVAFANIVDAVNAVGEIPYGRLAWQAEFLNAHQYSRLITAENGPLMSKYKGQLAMTVTHCGAIREFSQVDIINTIRNKAKEHGRILAWEDVKTDVPFIYIRMEYYNVHDSERAQQALNGTCFDALRLEVKEYVTDFEMREVPAEVTAYVNAEIRAMIPSSPRPTPAGERYGGNNTNFASGHRLLPDLGIETYMGTSNLSSYPEIQYQPAPPPVSSVPSPVVNRASTSAATGPPRGVNTATVFGDPRTANFVPASSGSQSTSTRPQTGVNSSFALTNENSAGFTAPMAQVTQYGMPTAPFSADFAANMGFGYNVPGNSYGFPANTGNWFPAPHSAIPSSMVTTPYGGFSGNMIPTPYGRHSGHPMQASRGGHSLQTRGRNGVSGGDGFNNFGRRNNGQGNNPNDDSYNSVDLYRIMHGFDVRTTIMLRNVPNTMSLEDLKVWLDKTNFGEYDFMYLRIDFANNCPIGYAFINFVDPLAIAKFVTARVGRRWPNNNHHREAAVSYATIQGRDCLIAKFRNSSVMLEDTRFRPKLYFTAHHPRAGEEERFPAPDNMSKLRRSIENAAAIGLYPPRTGQVYRANQRSRQSQFDRGTQLAQIEEQGHGRGQGYNGANQNARVGPAAHVQSAPHHRHHF